MIRTNLKALNKALWRGFTSITAPLRHGFGSIRSLRRLAFDTTQKDTFIAVSCPNESFIVSANDSTIARHVYVKKNSFDFEKFETTLKLLPKTHSFHTLLDIGANIGTISIPAIKRNHFQLAIAVEPDPLNYSLLTANIHLNGVSERFTCHNAAVGESSENRAVFGLSEVNHGDHRIVWDNNDDIEEARKQIEIDVVTMNQITGDLDAGTGFVWMDIQGYEGHALSNASKLKNSGIPMCLEFWPYGLKQSGGYELLKKALVDGKWNIFIDLDNPSERHVLSANMIDFLFNRIGFESAGTDILVLCE